MAKKVVWVVASCLMVLSLVMASCGPKEEVVKEEPAKEEPAKEKPAKEEPVQKEPVGVPGKEVPWWDRVFGEPEYGGTMTFRLGADQTTFDPWYGDCQLQVYDFMFHYVNTASEDVAKTWAGGGTGGPQLSLGWMAESREKIDPLTYVIHLRKGIRWQNKPPLNGREFTAYDVEYHQHRVLGLGKYGFTTPSPWVDYSLYKNVASIEATDKYTIVYKFKQFQLGNEGMVGGDQMRSDVNSGHQTFHAASSPA